MRFRQDELDKVQFPRIQLVEKFVDEFGFIETILIQNIFFWENYNYNHGMKNKDSDGKCWYRRSYSKIAESLAINISEYTVRYHLTKLKNNGIIEIKNPTPKSAMYFRVTDKVHNLIDDKNTYQFLVKYGSCERFKDKKPNASPLINKDWTMTNNGLNYGIDDNSDKFLISNLNKTMKKYRNKQ